MWFYYLSILAFTWMLMRSSEMGYPGREMIRMAWNNLRIMMGHVIGKDPHPM